MPLPGTLEWYIVFGNGERFIRRRLCSEIRRAEVSRAWKAFVRRGEHKGRVSRGLLSCDQPNR